MNDNWVYLIIKQSVMYTHANKTKYVHKKL